MTTAYQTPQVPHSITKAVHDQSTRFTTTTKKASL